MDRCVGNITERCKMKFLIGNITERCKMKFLIPLLLVACLMLTGCGRGPENHNIPTGATDIVYIGNNWATFSLTLKDGKKRQFIFYRRSHKCAITELSPVVEK